MQEYQTYHYIFQNMPSKREVNKIMGQNILKCAINFWGFLIQYDPSDGNNIGSFNASLMFKLCEN